MSFEKEIIEAEFRTVSSSKTLKEIEELSNGILKLKRETENLERRKKEAAAQYGTNSKQVKALTAKIKENNTQLSLQKSRLEQVNQKLKITEMSSGQLRKRQAELKKALESVNKEAFPDRWNKLNKAYQETSIQLNKVTNGGNAVKKGMGSVMNYAKGLLPAFGFTAIAGGIISLSKELFSLSVQMKSDNIRNTTIFGDSLSYVEKAAAELHKTMGLTRREFVANAASSADLLKPLGFTTEKAAKLSVKIQQLAGPLAEWSKGKYNAVQITEILNGAMTGEMERLKGLGIIIQQGGKEYTDLVKVKQKEENCSLNQAKALATLELMYRKSADAQTAYVAGGNRLYRVWEGLKATIRGYKENFVAAFDETTEERLIKQQRLVNSLAVQLTNTNTSESERVRILGQLQSINPRIVEGLNAEKMSVQQLKDNLRLYNDEIAKTIALEQLNEQERTQQAKLAETQLKRGEMQVSLGDNMMKLDKDIALDTGLTDEEKYAKIVSKYQNRTKKNVYGQDVDQFAFATTPAHFNETGYNKLSGESLNKDTRSVEEKNIANMKQVYDLFQAASAMEAELKKQADDVVTRIEKIKSAISGGVQSGKSGSEPDTPIFTDEEQKNQKAALSKSGTVGQEDENYKKALIDAGLFDKKKEELTGESLRALEAINKQHQDNISKLDRDAIAKYLDEKKAGYQSAITELQIQQNTELSSVKSLEDAKAILSKNMTAEQLNSVQTMEQAKKALTEQYNKKEREETKKQVNKLTEIIGKIQTGKEIEGLKLADKFISPEENKLIKERLQQAQDSLAKITADDAKVSMEMLAAQEKVRGDIIRSGMTLTEQENAAYQQRLINAGLFDKQKEDLTGESLKAFEVLEKAHQKKLNEIDVDSIGKYMAKKQEGYNKELRALKLKQTQELNSITSMKQAKALLAQTMSSSELSEITNLTQAKQALQKQYDQEARQMLTRQTNELLAIIKTLSDGGGLPDLKLSDKILSEEEKKDLEERLATLKEALAKLTSEDVNFNLPKESGVDLLGMSPEQWQAMFDNIAQGKFSLEDMQGVANAMFEGWGMVNQLMNAKENKELKNYEQNTKKKKDALNKQLNDGQISQEQYNARVAQLDSDLDAKKEAIERKQVKRQKAMAITQIVVNTSLAIMKTAAAIAFPWNIPFIAMAAALGAVQLATVMNQPDGFKKGGFTSRDKSDDTEAGIVHANEFVATAQAVRNPTVLPVLQMIDKAQRDGTISTLDLSDVTRHSGFKSGGFTSALPDADTINSVLNINSAFDPEIKLLLRKNIEMMEELKQMDVYISMFGRNGLMKSMRKANKYEQDTTY